MSTPPTGWIFSCCTILQGGEQKLIIEYDGFREHFGESAAFDPANYEEYYSEDDVFRQKVLESYGYRFLRVNRFNVGRNPVATLDERLRKATSEKTGPKPHQLLQSIHNSIEHLKNGDLKECPKCNELRKADEFRDASLASGVGRFCRQCKSVRVPHRANRRY